jgi:hypothetical protein
LSFLQVDLGATRPVKRFVVKHASAGGEDDESDTREFNIQVSTEGKVFTTVESSTGAGFVEERTEYRDLSYFDGRSDVLLAGKYAAGLIAAAIIFGGGAARLGGRQRHSPARGAEAERSVLPAVPVSRPGADGR